MREAGKKKKLELNSLTSGIRIKSKKIGQDETEIQNINLGGTCTRRLSPLWRKRLAWLAGIVQENSSFDYSLPSLWLSQCTF